MDYPAWVVPFLTAPMLIPIIAIPHVIVAQFAVGGGIVLADLVRRAYRQDARDVLDVLYGCTRFFVLITIVFGAVTGVGIWWTIGLTSPETTGALIRIFVFGWAAEWVMFLIEIVSAFLFYYLWNRLTPRDHIRLGYVYAVSAWLSLVVITAITAFMLTAGTWRPGAGFFRAFFNPSFLPQVLIRTGGSLALAALWIGLLVSFPRLAPGPRDRIIRWVSQWALVGMNLILLGGIWFIVVLPSHAQHNLVRAPLLIIMAGLTFAVTMVVLGALALGYATGSRWITPPAAVLLLVIGMVAVTTGEFVREGARKPYRIDQYILAPGIRVSDLPRLQARGLIAETPWLREYLRDRIPGFHPAQLKDLTPEQQVEVGAALYRYVCSSCHALFGYNGLLPIIRSWPPQLVRDALRHLHDINPAMPPWPGTPVEREALAMFLIRLNRNLPKEFKP